MNIKRKISDFACAFIVFIIILLSIAVLTGESFFEGTIEWDSEKALLSVFGTEFEFDKKVSTVAELLVDFNDNIFADGFSDVLMGTWDFFAQYIANGVSLAYRISRMALGAQ